MQDWKCLFGPETYGQTTAMYLCICMWSHPSVATFQVIIKDGHSSKQYPNNFHFLQFADICLKLLVKNFQMGLSGAEKILTGKSKRVKDGTSFPMLCALIYKYHWIFKLFCSFFLTELFFLFLHPVTLKVMKLWNSLC